MSAPDRHAPGHPLHLVQRGWCRAACFPRTGDRRRYLEALKLSAVEAACALHAYVLMGNHVHLLLTPAVAGGATRLMEGIASRYCGARERGAPLWERFEIRPVPSRRYLLATMRYIELNPVRAGLVAQARDFPWSSHRANAFGACDSLLSPHAFYCALGRSPVERQAAYRALFA